MAEWQLELANQKLQFQQQWTAKWQVPATKQQQLLKEVVTHKQELETFLQLFKNLASAQGDPTGPSRPERALPPVPVMLTNMGSDNNNPEAFLLTFQRVALASQ